MRHLGRVRARVYNPALRAFLLTEMVARVAKVMLRQRFRDLLTWDAEAGTNAEISMNGIVTDLFNEIICTKARKKGVKALVADIEKLNASWSSHDKSDGIISLSLCFST